MYNTVMDDRLNRKEISELNDACIAIEAMFEAMKNFYQYNSHILRTDYSRLNLMHRIGCCIDIALNQNNASDLYAADLIHLDEQLNIGIRGRKQNRNLMVLNFMLNRPPNLKLLAGVCGQNRNQYRFGVGIRLFRKYYLLNWLLPPTRLGKVMGFHFAHHEKQAFYLGPDPRQPFQSSPARINW